LPAKWLDRFFAGLIALATASRIPLAGGDLTRSNSALVLADITVVGSVPRGRALLRSAAKPGDAIYVTGSLGASALELSALRAHPKKFARITSARAAHPHLFSQPRIAAGLTLYHRGVRACMDISDGLALDLSRLCESSGVAAEISAAAIPRPAHCPLDLALHAGEDYELLFTAPASAHIPSRIAGTAITQIGRITRAKKSASQLALISQNGTRTPLAPTGWDPFR
jgi:thiamine-monophosphate kinase